MREAFDGIKKIPHPEEAAKQLSRRTHGADPADREFPYSLFRGGDEYHIDITAAILSRSLRDQSGVATSLKWCGFPFTGSFGSG
jgi:hypothetical protein